MFLRIPPVANVAEYIGQLESELAGKANEASDMRLQNRALMEENSRLTDLTRLLLSSPHFANFLNDFGPNSLPFPNPANDSASMASEPSMEPNFDFAAPVEVPQSWNSGIDAPAIANPAVFAVTDVPEPESLDVGALNDKTCDLPACSLPCCGAPFPVSCKDGLSFPGYENDDVLSRDDKDVPLLEQSPAAVETETEQSEVDVSPTVDGCVDPSLALFDDQYPDPLTDVTESGDVFCIQPEKLVDRLELRVERDSAHGDDAAITRMRFARLCASLDDACARVEQATVASWRQV